MPHKKSDLKGDLYLVVDIAFPEDGWTEDEESFASLEKILPAAAPKIEATEIDELEFTEDANIDEVSISYLRSLTQTNRLQFGAGSGQGGGEGWEDEDEEGGAQCTQQ